MIKQFKLMVKELQDGENLNLYTTIALAMIVAVLGLAGAVSFEILSAAILATLGLIAGSLLESRRNVSEVKSAANKPDSEIATLKQDILNSNNSSRIPFRRDFPDFSRDFQTATKICVLGASLHSTTIRYYSDYANALKRGVSLRVLVCEPSANVLSMQVLRTHAIQDVDILGRTVRDHIALMEKLKTSIPNGKCESRTIPLIISFGLVVVESSDGTAKAYIKLMPFRTPGSEYPVFEVSKRNNQEWFEFFSNQFELLWASSNPVS